MQRLTGRSSVCIDWIVIVIGMRTEELSLLLLRLPKLFVNC
jgi:hypothetical protein